MRTHHDATVGDCGLEETLTTIRDEMRKFADSEVKPHAQAWHRTNSYIPLDVAFGNTSELGVFGLTIAEEHGGLGLGKEFDVRRLRGAFSRLYRGRLARHALRDRGRVDHRWRHRGAEAQVAAEARLRRGAADRGIHRAQYRFRPRLAQDPGGAGGQRLQDLRQQDLDHPSCACRSHDPPGAHQSERARPSRALHAAGGEAARHRRRTRSRRLACRAPRSRCWAIAA